MPLSSVPMHQHPPQFFPESVRLTKGSLFTVLLLFKERFSEKYCCVNKGGFMANEGPKFPATTLRREGLACHVNEGGFMAN